MTGPSPIFEGEKGFMKVVSGSFELPRLGGRPAQTVPLVPFKILDTYIKHFLLSTMRRPPSKPRWPYAQN